MLKTIGLLISLSLIVIISLTIPQESLGLASFANKSNVLGSPSSAQRSLNILIGLGIFLYFAIAVSLNFLNN